MSKKTTAAITGIALIFSLLTAWFAFPGAAASGTALSADKPARYSPVSRVAAVAADLVYQPGNDRSTVTGSEDLFSSIRSLRTQPAPLSPTPELVIPKGCEVTANLAYEFKLFELINEEREKRNLQTLTWNEDLASAARKHSIDMACNDFFSHVNPEGLSFSDRIGGEGYDYFAAGENIYAGDEVFNSPYRAFRAWFYSTDHFIVMTHPALTELGIGYVYGDGSRYGGYFTADFASPEPE